MAEKEFMTYAEKLRDPRWQKRRLEIMQRDDFMCRDCGETTKTLNVDHRVYRRGLNPWEYPDECLWTLCQECHEEITGLRQQLAERIGQFNSYDLKQAIRLLEYIPFLDEVLIFHGEDDKKTGVLPSSSWKRLVKFIETREEALMQFVDEEITREKLGE